MATTENGTYYPGDYTLEADVPGDMKKMAESIDANKVQKIEGKGLSTEDFTKEYKQKLDDLENYDDTEIKEEIESLKTDNTTNKSNIEELQEDNTQNKSDISDIKEEQATQNANIENLQENDATQDELIYKLKSALINVETEEAKSLHIEDASEVPAQLSVAGNQEQETREGYNMLNSSLFDLSEVSDYATFNSDGTITFNGTVNADINIRSLRKQTIEGTGKENIVIKTLGGSLNGVLRLVAQDTNYGNIKYSQIGTSAFNDKLIENVEYNIFSITITNGTVLNNLKLGFMIVDDSDVDKEYEQYGASPSPDYPSKVVCLGSNKNLLHMQEKSYTQLGVNVTQKESCLKLDGTTNGAQNILSGGYVDIGNFKKGKYSFKAHISGSFERQGKNDFAFYIRKKDDTSKIYGSIGGATIENSRNSFTFELTEDTDLVIQIWANASGIIFNNFEMKLKVEEGETATSYSPYGQGSTEIIKINNVSNFDTLANGTSSGDYFGLQFEMLNKFSCKITGKPNSNELRFGNSYNSKEILIPFEKGKHYKVKNSFNSASEITLVNLKENSFRLVYVTNKSEIQIQEGDDGISSVRLYPDTNTTYNNEIVTCLIYTQEDDDFIPGQTDYILNIQQEMSSGDYFVKEEDGWKEVHNWTKIDSYNSESITTDYISTTGELTTGATIYYKLATPTKLPCTEEQSAVLDEIDNLDLFEGVNNIITAENIAKLKLKYVADTKTYVDKEISDIKEQINTINELLSTTGTSSLLLDNLQSDLESEVM